MLLQLQRVDVGAEQSNITEVLQSNVWLGGEMRGVHFPSSLLAFAVAEQDIQPLLVDILVGQCEIYPPTSSLADDVVWINSDDGQEMLSLTHNGNQLNSVHKSHRYARFNNHQRISIPNETLALEPKLWSKYLSLFDSDKKDTLQKLRRKFKGSLCSRKNRQNKKNVKLNMLLL